MEAFLQARSRDAGIACARGLPVRIDRVVANLASRFLDRRHCDDRAVAVDVARHQAHQRRVARDSAREGRAAAARPCRQMAGAPCRAYRIGRARHGRALVCMPATLGDYRALITQLHRRIEKAGGKAALIGGVKPGVYAAGIALLVLVAIAISGLLVRAVATAEWAGGLFLVGFAALFAWQVGGFVWRNRPRAYTSDHLPEALLP